MPWITRGTSGSSTRSTTLPPAAVASAAGGIALNASLSPAGTMTSLISGLPSRDTWVYPEPSAGVPLALRSVGRVVVLQTPMTGFAVASPSIATADLGTSSTMLLTL
jgi:hypothetical protein